MPSEPESKVRDLMQALGDSVERAKAKRAAVAEPPELGERCSECSSWDLLDVTHERRSRLRTGGGRRRT
jgi:hypothetical protein